MLQLGVWRPSLWMQLQLQALDMSLRCLGRRITLVQLLFESAAAAPWCWRLSHDPIGVLKCACRRITLVQLLFESAAAAPLPETDPELRAALLDSLKSYEAAERARPAFTERPQVPIPAAAQQQAQQERPAEPGGMPPWPTHCSRGLTAVVLIAFPVWPWAGA